MGQSEVVGNLFLALSKAQGEIEGAKKDSENPFFKSKYADLHECISAARPALTKYELAVVQTTDVDDKGYWIITTLGHSSGEWISGRLLMRLKKDDNQGIGDAITYGRRYAFAAIVGLAQMDDDGNSNKGDLKDKTKGKQPHQPSPDNSTQGQKSDKQTVLDTWEQLADKNAKTEAQLSAWWKSSQDAAKKAIPADQFAILESYVSQLMDTFDETSPEEKKAVEGWIGYMRSLKDIDVLTTSFEEKLEKTLKNYRLANQEKLENCRRECAAKLMEGK